MVAVMVAAVGKELAQRWWRPMLGDITKAMGNTIPIQYHWILFILGTIQYLILLVPNTGLPIQYPNCFTSHHIMHVIKLYHQNRKVVLTD